MKGVQACAAVLVAGLLLLASPACGPPRSCSLAYRVTTVKPVTAVGRNIVAAPPLSSTCTSSISARAESRGAGAVSTLCLALWRALPLAARASAQALPSRSSVAFYSMAYCSGRAGHGCPGVAGGLRFAAAQTQGRKQALDC